MKKLKTNHDLVAHVFPRFRLFDCFYSEFPLALKGIFLSSERPLLFLWFWFHNTRSKSALLSKSLMYNVGARHSHKVGRDMIVGGNCTYSWNLISQHGIIRTANKNKERNFLSSERPLLFLWFWFHITRSKSALLSKSLMYNVGARHSHKVGREEVAV